MSLNMTSSGWYDPPATRDATDDPGTACLRTYPGVDVDDNHSEEHTECSLCNGVLCLEYDDKVDCGDGPAHEGCHQQGCNSLACDDQRRDDDLLDRAGL